MKCSENWLREWANPNLSRQELCHVLTMGGLEVEEIYPVAENFSDILVGKIIRYKEHPNASKLTVCEVDIGKESLLTVVCGAPNVKKDLKTAVALVGASLPSKGAIKETDIRGVTSYGMLCSSAELGISEEGEGIIELSQDAPIGEDLWHYLKLEDHIIDINITPNRGDCLSVKGIAREIHALTNTALTDIKVSTVANKTNKTIPILIEDKIGCPHYVGRIISNVMPDAESPVWLVERLRRSGIRRINAVVDVVNYVMLELGQPMHAFDLEKIEEGIVVRSSKRGEEIALLDGSSKILNAETTIIADKKKPLAIAGVMGGLDSSVTLFTKNILIESAYFPPEVIAKQRQYYALNSDSAYRFERGVDPTLQVCAIERVTDLILKIAGGEAGPIIDKKFEEQIPTRTKIKLDKEKLDNLLGISIPTNIIESIFNHLFFEWKAINKTSWEITPPTYRFDLTLPEDIIEEIIRVYGYHNIPVTPLVGKLEINNLTDVPNDLRKILSSQGLSEIVSYSFVDKKLQALFSPDSSGISLMNPISSDMAIMRTSLLPGLIQTYQYNQARQQTGIKLFEIGTCFTYEGTVLNQKPALAGLISGERSKEQWGVPSKVVDFFDLKGLIENTFSAYKKGHSPAGLTFKKGESSFLHPGQTADIYLNHRKVGIMGLLHPTIKQSLDVHDNLFLFEIDLTLIDSPKILEAIEVSKFPEIRRDIAIIVNEATPAKEIQDTIETIAGVWLKDIYLFDVYQGKGIPEGHKSLAFALILQNRTRTLVDSEVSDLLERVIEALKGKFRAYLRSKHDANEGGSS